MPIPDKVEVTVSGSSVKVKGPKGELERQFPGSVTVKVEDGQIIVERPNDHRTVRSAHGLVRSIIGNMVEGVSKGFERKLEVNGVGYKAEMKGKSWIRFDLGYSHPIYFELPQGISAEIGRGNVVTLTGIDKEVIGTAAATIRSFRPPEPYKGKGVKYAEETILRKVGKSGR